MPSETAYTGRVPDPLEYLHQQITLPAIFHRRIHIRQRFHAIKIESALIRCQSIPGIPINRHPLHHGGAKAAAPRVEGPDAGF